MTNYSNTNLAEKFREKFGEGFADHLPLSQLMPSQLGGVTNWYLTAKTTADLVDAAKLAIESKCPYRVIGSGTATLIGESGFPGLIISNQTGNCFSVSQGSRLTVDAGLKNDQLIKVAATAGLGGVEQLSVIPGTLGGAVLTKAHVDDWQIASYVREVSYFDPETERIRSAPASELAELSRLTKPELIFPAILLTITIQLAQLTQEEVLRRLGKYRQLSQIIPTRAFGRFLTNEPIDRQYSRQFKELGVAFDTKNGWLLLNKLSTPTSVKQAIKLLINGLPIEHPPQITYLGYYQGDND